MTSGNNSDSGLKWFTAIVSCLTFLATGGLAIYNYQIDSKIKQLAAQKTEIEIRQTQESFQRDFKVKMLELCINALKDKNSKQQDVALIAVQKLVKENDEFKQGLVSILTDSENPEVRKAAKSAEIVLQKDKEIIKEIPKAKYRKVFVDIFYYEGQPNSKILAQKLYDALKFSDLFQLRGYIKQLSVKTNQEPNYNVGTTKIRFDPNEEENAKLLQKMATPLLDNYGLTSQIEKAKTGSVTPGYLSFFVMEGPK
jgi:hypothetical protein